MTLACVAYGDPIPTISWNKGSSRLTNSSAVTILQEVLSISGVTLAKSILEICTPGVNDAGQYSCFAEDSAPANFEVVVNQGKHLHLVSYLHLDTGTVIAVLIELALSLKEQRGNTINC